VQLRLLIDKAEPLQGTLGPFDVADLDPTGLGCRTAVVAFNGWLGLMQAIAAMIDGAGSVPRDFNG
jgi:hypothetical protein